MYGAAGAPARSASAPVVRSARRPPPQATGSVEKGVLPTPTRSFPPEPQPVGALRGGEARERVWMRGDTCPGEGGGGSGRSVLRPALVLQLGRRVQSSRRHFGVRGGAAVAVMVRRVLVT